MLAKPNQRGFDMFNIIIFIIINIIINKYEKKYYYYWKKPKFNLKSKIKNYKNFFKKNQDKKNYKKYNN